MVLGAVAFQIKPKGVSSPTGDEEDVLWLFTEWACPQLPASFMHLLMGSVRSPWDCKAPQEGWREGNHGLVPTVGTGIFSLPLDGWLAPLVFISAGSWWQLLDMQKGRYLSSAVASCSAFHAVQIHSLG